MSEKILIIGGSGILGQKISSFLITKGIEVIVVSRTKYPKSTKKSIRYIQWDVDSDGIWTKEIDNAFAIINLSGSRVSKRLTKKNRIEIYASRINSIEAIRKAIQQSKQPPKIWINAAAANIYGNDSTQTKDERSVVSIESNFLIDLCRTWEFYFSQARVPNTKKILLRIGTVLGKEGYFQFIKILSKFGVQKIGSNNTAISWIHEEDFARIIFFLLKNQPEGIFNCTAPQPVLTKNLLKYLNERNPPKTSPPQSAVARLGLATK